MSTRTFLYALAVAIATFTLPAAASARPLYDTGPSATPTAAHAVSNGPSPLLVVAAVLSVALLVVAARVVRVRPFPVKT